MVEFIQKLNSKKWWIKNRQSILNNVYQQLLLTQDHLNVEQELIDASYSEDYIKVVQDILTNKDQLISKVDDVLKKEWNFKRLHVLSQAALICGSYEILILEKPKAIIINSYVEILKSISDPKTVKLINALLDKI